jgi:hypothetical protein
MSTVRIGVRVCALAALLSLWRPGTVGAEPQAAAPPTEMMLIDGSKSPELIPQWSAWGYAFRVFAGGPRQLPTSVLEHVTRAETTFVMAQADRVQRVDAECQARLLKMIAGRGADKPDELDRKVRALSIQCRTRTIEARDRVLAGLNADAQTALIAFVESTKAGTSLTLPKSQLARFREPE